MTTGKKLDLDYKAGQFIHDARNNTQKRAIDLNMWHWLSA